MTKRTNSGELRARTLTVRVTRTGVEHIDTARGSWTRGEYIRRALALAAQHDLAGPPKRKPNLP